MTEAHDEVEVARPAHARAGRVALVGIVTSRAVQVGRVRGPVVICRLGQQVREAHGVAQMAAASIYHRRATRAGIQRLRAGPVDDVRHVAAARGSARTRVHDRVIGRHIAADRVKAAGKEPVAGPKHQAVVRDAVVGVAAARAVQVGRVRAAIGSLRLQRIEPLGFHNPASLELHPPRRRTGVYYSRLAAHGVQVPPP